METPGGRCPITWADLETYIEKPIKAAFEAGYSDLLKTMDGMMTAKIAEAMREPTAVRPTSADLSLKANMGSKGKILPVILIVCLFIYHHPVVELFR